MTYFSFLGLFLAIPIAIMLGLTWRDARLGRQIPQRFASYSPYAILALHLVMALVYTTPWYTMGSSQPSNARRVASSSRASRPICLA